MRHDVILVALEDRFGVSRFPMVLYRAGCRITVLGNPRSVVASSRFIDRLIPCGKNADMMLRLLQKLLAEWDEAKPWVVFTDEISLQFATERRDEPWLSPHLPVEVHGPRLDMVLRKTSFMESAEAGGIPVPPMRICRSLAEAQAAGEQLRFPLFLKRDVDCAGAGVIQVHRPEDIAPAYYVLCNSGPVLVQQMVHGRLAKANMIYLRGRPMCWTSAYALNSWPGKFGPSTIRESLCDPQLDEIVMKLGDLIGFHGLCGYDAIREQETGRFIVIEFNGRLTPHYHLGRHFGVDYSRAIGDFVSGKFSEQRPRLTSASPPLIYIFPQDLRRCISDHDYRGLLKWIPGMSTKDIPWGDFGLVLHVLVTFVQLAIRRIRRMLRLKRLFISHDRAKNVQIGMSYADVIARLGPPMQEIGGEIRFMVYRMFGGEELLVGISLSEPADKVISMTFKKHGQTARDGAYAKV